MSAAPMLLEAVSALDYQRGLSRLKEAVISSHFMDAIARDPSMKLYDRETLDTRSLVLSGQSLDHRLIPILVEGARRFAQERASAAAKRALQNHSLYGIANAADVGEAEIVTEVMFDRQFAKNAAATCSRTSIRDQVQAALIRDRTLTMVIPALPFKMPSPLKVRGDQPDLAEVGFLLALYETALAVDLASAQKTSGASALVSHFVVVSDGMRFADLANVSSGMIAQYRHRLEAWISRLGLGRYVVVKDYCELLEENLPANVLAEKRRIAEAARVEYAAVLKPVFDPCAMADTFAASRAIEPDPEAANVDGRFNSLLRSLVYTINYRSLEAIDLPVSANLDLYRELTSRLFEPIEGTTAQGRTCKETVRQAMLEEVWQAAIDYMAEIKSDRDLDYDPILTCLPGAIRWTIHAKPGQLAIATSSVHGVIVQAWAGAAVFRPTSNGRIRLCSYPVLGLEGEQAVPVLMPSSDAGVAPQPLFYIDSRVAGDDIDGFLDDLAARFCRRRSK